MLDARTPLCLLLCSWCAAGCASETPDTPRPSGSAGGAAAAGKGRGNAGSDDTSDGTSTMFGNAAGARGAGTGGAGVTPSKPKPDAMCSPGTYVGTYTCTLEMDGVSTIEIAGDVSFDLSNKVTMQECQEDDEFCDDLVIAPGSGKLFGFAVLIIGFQTSLEGGLDCATGMFHAETTDGIWGLPVPVNPDDPDSPLTVADPAFGMFDGDMSGVHLAGATEAIDGTWSLEETSMMLKCPGPFHVELQP